jgi:hypothetical protein
MVVCALTDGLFHPLHARAARPGCMQVVDTLRTRLRDATAEFKDVLTARSENIKVHQERRQLFTNQAKGGAWAAVGQGQWRFGDGRGEGTVWRGSVR